MEGWHHTATGMVRTETPAVRVWMNEFWTRRNPWRVSGLSALRHAEFPTMYAAAEAAEAQVRRCRLMDTMTMTINFTRGRLIIEAPNAKAYGVESDGDIRGRELIWVEKDGAEPRIIPATAFRDYVGLES